ncbi:MAG: cyclic nucleotide-binding domain-containing protein, partial [Spirochaetes bacterium]|nr:cyclic nucleotide-binding domain-containing protein [Spirochaetota bacterium]
MQQDSVQLSMAQFKKGSFIIVEGKLDSNEFYIIRSGKVQIQKEDEIVEDEAGNVLNPGDFFGV